MGMGLARDVRSANMAAAERRERSKYRQSAEARSVSAEKRAESGEARAVSAEKRAVNLNKSRIESIKDGIRHSAAADRRGEKADSRADSAEQRSVEEAALQRQIAQYKLENLQDPSVNTYRSNRRLLEAYQKDINAGEQRFADQVAPINAQIQSPSTNPADLLHLHAVKKKLLADHKDFKAGLEQSFMSASNRPYEGKWSIRPYFNEFTNSMSYGAIFEGGSAAEAKAALESIKSMGGNTSISAGATPATPAQSANPSNPLGLTLPSNQRINPNVP